MKYDVKSKTHGIKEIQIDKKNIHLLSEYSFVLQKTKNNCFYLKARIKGINPTKNIYLHRLIMSAIENEIIDHKDGNTLNFLESNLRRCTTKENSRNSNKWNKKTTSKYKGVSYKKNEKKYMAYIVNDNKQKYLGYFDNEISAAIAYNNAAIKCFGEYAKINNFSNKELKDDKS